MSIANLLQFLVGQRQAILKIAETPAAVWLGLLLVLSAAFAREYDGEDLLHAPWHLVLPAAASLVTSALLFGTVWVVSRGSSPHWSVIPSAYRSFLGIYWMTAPLAWLYAIPVERLATGEEATAANLWLLGIVAGWRVVLMARVVSVLYGANMWQAVCVVMLFADALALVVLRLTPLPVFSIMGGIRLSESEQMIQSTTFMVGAAGIVSLPLWFFGTISAAVKKGLSWSTATSVLRGERRVSPSAWLLGVASLLVWVPILPFTQPEQQLRHEVESDLRGGQIHRALTTMSAHERGDFPPHWDSPPRVGYGEQQPPILDVVETLLEMDAKPWVVELFVEKLRSRAGYSFGTRYYFYDMDDEQFDRHLALLEQLPTDSPIHAEWRNALEQQLTNEEARTEAQRTRLRVLLEPHQDLDAPAEREGNSSANERSTASGELLAERSRD